MNNFFNWGLDKNGGTEYMARNTNGLILNDLPKFKDYACVLFPGVNNLDLISTEKKPIIIWMHNHFEEFDNKIQTFIRYNLERNMVKFIIAVSETHKKMLEKQINDKYHNLIIVVPNYLAVMPEYNAKKFENVEKVQMIYFSHHLRGLHILLESLKYIDDDFSLNVFSNIDPEKEKIKPLIEACKDKRLMLFGTSPRITINKYLKDTHIHSYPGFYQETFCLTQIEAMASGCLPIFGKMDDSSLEEITGPFGISMNLNRNDFYDNAKKYAGLLKNGIDLIKNNSFNPEEQIQYIKDNYSLEVAKENWKKVHDVL